MFVRLTPRYLRAYALAAAALLLAPALHAQTVSDYDGDGVPNATDLDDDNDGIPDAIENPCALDLPSKSPSTTTNLYTEATEIVGDFGGFWHSGAGAAANATRPDARNHVLALKIGGRYYPTGVPNARLTDAVDENGQPGTDGRLDGLDLDGDGTFETPLEATDWTVLRPTNDVLTGVRLEPPGADGSATNATGSTLVTDGGAPSNPYLHQGIDGFDMSYGMANIGNNFDFNVSGVIAARVGDGVPDVIVNQVADPGSGNTTIAELYLRDIDGNYLGTGVAVDWESVPSLGSYRVDQYSVSNGAASANQVKAIRYVGVDFADFALDANDYAKVASLQVNYSANSDPTFVAVNEDSFNNICNPPDTDGDGITDDRDTDSDNDGISDAVEAGATDADLDGRADYAGTFASNDADGDGLLDAYDPDVTGGTDGADLTASPRFDADGDGVPNHRDLDSDGDGITDVVENAAGDETADAPTQAEALDGCAAGFSDSGTTPDGYGDGYDDAASNPGPTDTDGDSIPDFLDLDADNDGLRDDYEHSCATCPGFGAPATPTDANGNGLDDAYEARTYANATGGGNAGANPVTTDGPNEDYRQTDADGDGLSDWSDGFDDDEAALDRYVALITAYNNANDPGAADIDVATDSDGDGVPDFADNLAGPGYDEASRPPFLTAGDASFVDANGNGLADVFDPYVPGGQDAAPAGGTSPFFRDAAAGAPVPVELYAFSVEADEDCTARASWAVGTEYDVARYELHVSADGEAFAPVTSVRASAKTEYAATVPTGGDAAYYRLVTHDFDGLTSVSEVLRVSAACSRATALEVAPSYLRAGTDASLRTNLPSGARVRLVDVTGRVVLETSAEAGGAVSLPALRDGIYVLAAGQSTHARLVVR